MASPSYRTAALSVAGLVSAAVAVFVAGLLTERYRPLGSEWHRMTAVRMARLIGEMRNETCCCGD